MSEIEHRESAAAKPKVYARPFTQITSVIYMGPWTIKERIAAAAAIGIVSGVLFFFIWLYLTMGGDGPWPSLLWAGGAALVMTAIAFIHPGWAEILFGKMFIDRD